MVEDNTHDDKQAVTTGHECQRLNLINKLKNVANQLRNEDDVTTEEVKEQPDSKEKYISDWVPPWTKVDPKKHPLLPLPKPPSDVQLRGGDLHGPCLCLKRNGVQDDCPKKSCQGKFECLTKPIPTCVPSGLARPVPKEILISKAKQLPCTKEETAEERAKRIMKEKTEIMNKYIQLARKHYTDFPPLSKKLFKPCRWHDGKYKLKSIMHNAENQTSAEDYNIVEYTCSKAHGEGEPQLNRVNSCLENITNKDGFLSEGVRKNIMDHSQQKKTKLRGKDRLGKVEKKAQAQNIKSASTKSNKNGNQGDNVSVNHGDTENNHVSVSSETPTRQEEN